MTACQSQADPGHRGTCCWGLQDTVITLNLVGLGSGFIVELGRNGTRILGRGVSLLCNVNQFSLDESRFVTGPRKGYLEPLGCRLAM